MLIQLNTNGRPINFECDTGATVTLLPLNVYDSIAPRELLCKNTGLNLKTLSGHSIPVVGQALVHVTRGTLNRYLPVVVAEGPGVPLLGRDWFRALGFAVVDVPTKTVLQTRSTSENPADVNIDSARIVAEYAAQYSCSGPGCYNGPPVSLLLDPSVPPIKLNARVLPYAKKEGVR